MPRLINGRCRGSTCRVAALLAAVFLGPVGPLLAQDRPDAELAGVMEGVRRGVPTPTEAMAAYEAVRGWVRELAVPSEPAAELVRPIGASVTLRYQGRVIGRGVAMALDRDGPALRDAARLAIGEALERLPGDRDALWPETSKQLARELAVSVELAGQATPILPAQWSDVLGEVEPGVQGVAVRVRGSAERIEAMFPWAMLSTQTEPPAALRSLAGRVLEDAPGVIAKTPEALAGEHGLVFLRFDVVHVAQVEASGPAMFMHRGRALVRSAQLDGAELRRWRGELAASLRSRALAIVRQRTRIEVAGREDGSLSPDGSAALALWALARSEQLGEEDGELWSAVASIAERGTQASAAESAVALLACAAARPGASATEASLARTREQLAAALGTRVGAKPGAEDELDRSIPPGARSLVLLALASQAGDAERAGRVVRATRRMLIEQGAVGLPGQQPWLSMLAREPSARGAGLDLAVPLRETLDGLWAAQLQPETLTELRRDCAGGIRLAGDGGALPTWHSARAIAGAAVLLGDDRTIAAEERPRQTARVLAGLRFLRQLTVDETTLTGPGAARGGDARAGEVVQGASGKGGVRASVWDQRQPIEATALTLVAVDATLRSLESR